MFLPYEKKDFSMDSLWSKASEVLGEADKIIVVGYSFPDYDKDIEELFKKSVSQKALIEIVDVDESLKARIGEIFPANEKKFFLDGFK